MSYYKPIKEKEDNNNTIKFCCDKFKEAVNEGVIMFFESSDRYELDGYDMKGDYPVNFCPNCGNKLQ